MTRKKPKPNPSHPVFARTRGFQIAHWVPTEQMRSQRIADALQILQTEVPHIQVVTDPRVVEFAKWVLRRGM